MKKTRDIEILEVSHMSRRMIKQGTEDIPIEYYYTEISASNVDKWNAIQYLIKRLNINKEDVIAIGDNINDIKMIENAGLGIVMRGSLLQNKNENCLESLNVLVSLQGMFACAQLCQTL